MVPVNCCARAGRPNPISDSVRLSRANRMTGVSSLDMIFLLMGLSFNNRATSRFCRTVLPVKRIYFPGKRLKLYSLIFCFPVRYFLTSQWSEQNKHNATLANEPALIDDSESV